MSAASPWLLNINKQLNEPGLQSVFGREVSGYLFKVFLTNDSCWLIVYWPKGSRIAFRMAYSPDDQLELKRVLANDRAVTFTISSLMGEYEVVLTLSSEETPVIRLKTTLQTAAPLLFPYWPRDIVPLGASSSDVLAEGEVKVSQVGARSGQLYFNLTRPRAGSVLYLQNLTALADYNQDTETSAGGTVGGEWPEIGFALPPTLKNKSLKANKVYTLSDAIIAFSEEVPADEPAMVQQYLDLLAAIYLKLSTPATTYKHWPDILQKGLDDLQKSPGCWSQVSGNHYFNAYVCDYKTPPEIMVQLAVLLPLTDYTAWSGTQLEMIDKIKAGLPAFYNEELGTIMRWHPKMADTMEGEEEHKKPLVMDSWYLQHPLLNLSRLALKGDKIGKKLFLDSLEFAIKVARHFDYAWPVFYNMDTLEVVKAETQPGKGGEKDVPGLYAHVMLQAWELTGERRYLTEAEKAAQRLHRLGFELFYQANNTSFSAGALLRLYRITKKEIYKDLSYLCLANVFKNVKLWDCNYGYGKNFPSFFALFPLNDAPYTAVYEEQEVFCAFHDYLHHARGQDILPSVRLLLSEYIRFLIDRAVYYYPTMLPKELLSEKVKTGEVDPNLWIALEDLHDGWEKSGEVGQEVYGAGNAFGIVPRHYMRVVGQPFMIYTDYPTYGFSSTKQRQAEFRLAGDGRLAARVMLVKTGKEKIPAFEIRARGQQESLKGRQTKEGHLEFTVPGDSEIQISWHKR
ncbi:hypothetical protein BEL04_06900 [Mucilaginibacter sp. PPCGB 2223]|uniref:hypothetical protein n=1 Tax=Mucilaginibacter sp. PPCGB 2223 TaxID=1886027 RepID=UPI0008266412|nr:hypothetical protein [Mucilaginibacter sp. PPCGB 2223]OCX53997.1 hypothetical protein BEL04_06900 [Mucilaginibacter sp. PPCGB 2223]